MSKTQSHTHTPDDLLTHLFPPECCEASRAVWNEKMDFCLKIGVQCCCVDVCSQISTNRKRRSCRRSRVHDVITVTL